MAEYFRNVDYFIHELLREQQAEERAEAVLDMTRLMINIDKAYQGPGSARGYKATDPHASYVREYILKQEPTGSTAYDEVFADMRRRLPELLQEHEKLRERFESLAEEWSENHPGESFFPGDSQSSVLYPSM